MLLFIVDSTQRVLPFYLCLANSRHSKSSKFQTLLVSAKMSRAQPHKWLSLLILFLVHLLHTSHADVGSAAQYPPPYLPTACYGSDSSQFPSSNLFAAAGDGIWDNGASCGRQYLVRCISAARTGTCVPDKTIQIRIVDYAGSVNSQPSASATTMVLSQTAFGAIANSSAESINIEFQQV